MSNPNSGLAASRPRHRSRQAGASIRLAGQALAIVMVVLGAGGCVTRPDSVDDHPQAVAVRELKTLSVVARPAEDGTYRRSSFGRAWVDTDGNHCRQRYDALWAGLDRSRPYQLQRRRGCAHVVVSGSWVDPYTGRDITLTNATDPAQAQQLPVDHIVALGVAHRYGARDWTPAQRLLFANDLRNLAPTSRSVNAAKGARDPAAWRPDKNHQCAYAQRYIAVKAAYSLPVDQAEKSALDDMLGRC